MRQAGRYLPEYRAVREKMKNFLEFCYSPEQAAEVTLQPLHRFNFDAAIIFSDILVIPDALGQEVDFIAGTGPVLKPLRSLNDISNLEDRDLEEKLDPVYQALRKVKSELPTGKTLIGFAGAPWTIATYMVEGGTSRDFAETKQWAFRAPEEFSVLISMLENSIAKHLIRQIKAGAEVVQIFDSWAGMLPDSAFRRWSLEPIARIVARVKAASPETPVIVFPRLAGERYKLFTEIPGINAVSLDQTMSLDWVRRELQPKIVVQGNMDPVYLIAGGDVMLEEARRILTAFGDQPFIFNLGHGVLPVTPPEHVAELCDFVTGWTGPGT